MQQTNPMKDKNEVAENSDNKIDQDFPGFPHGTASEKIIHPKTDTEKKIADVENTDGEKINKNETDESESDGSGGAFEATENSRDDD